MAASFGESLPWSQSFNVLASVTVSPSKNELASAFLSLESGSVMLNCYGAFNDVDHLSQPLQSTEYIHK